MTEPRAVRRLAAVLAVDVVGYSRLMEADEAGTLARLKALRAEFLHPKVTEYGGRIVKTTGDGTLVEFPSAVDAVQHAVDVQGEMARRNAGESEAKRIVLRMGINLGDIIIEGDDIYGDGVNVAARLEALAEPGGICLSGTVHEHVRNKLDATFEDIGEQTVKNIARPVHVYRVHQLGEIKSAPRKGEALPLPDRPSIAVLPFQNMSGDVEQEYFADGIAEDIITGLSRVRQLFVIARNSSFTYKGKSVDVRQVGRELGVRYVLEGSVRKVGNRVRLTVQLVDASSGNHLWAEKYDGAVEDVFELQDRITEGVVGAIEPSVREAEIDRARRKRPDSLNAYDLYLRALPHVWANDALQSVKALSFLDDALRIDPSYAAAHGLAALCHMLRFVQGGLDPAERTAALHHARTVLTSAVDDTNALSFAGVVLGILAREFDTALGTIEKAIALNPNSARAYANWGFVQMMTERDDEAAIEACQRAIRLSPFDPLNYGPQGALSIIHYRRGRFPEALEAAQRATQISGRWVGGLQMLAASYVRLGRLSEANDTVRRLLEIHPQYRLESVRNVRASGSATDSVVAALREAGLPE